MREAVTLCLLIFAIALLNAGVGISKPNTQGAQSKPASKTVEGSTTMSIVEDYFKESGETLREACLRMCKTHTVSQAALEIGFTSSTELRTALKCRGITVHWAKSDHKKRGGGRAPRITRDQVERYVALRQARKTTVESSRAVGVTAKSIRRAMNREYPHLLPLIDGIRA